MFVHVDGRPLSQCVPFCHPLPEQPKSVLTHIIYGGDFDLPPPLACNTAVTHPPWTKTKSPCCSVVFSGRDLKAVSENAPYPSRFADPCAASIAEAEKAVLAANAAKFTTTTTSMMLTCSVRAASVYGLGEDQEAASAPASAERLLLPGLASRAKTGARPVGDGTNVVDFVYAGNVAHALLLAAQALLLPLTPAPAAPAPASASTSASAAAAVAGRAFFVTDMEPVPFGEFVGRALSRLGYPAPSSASGGPGEIPVLLATLLAFLLRVVALVVSPLFEFRPALTSLRVAEESAVRRFDTTRASKDLGYAPLWNQEVLMCVCVLVLAEVRVPSMKSFL